MASDTCTLLFNVVFLYINDIVGRNACPTVVVNRVTGYSPISWDRRFDPRICPMRLSPKSMLRMTRSDSPHQSQKCNFCLSQISATFFGSGNLI